MAKEDFRAEPPEPRRQRPLKRRRPVDDDDDDDFVRDDYDDPVQTLVPYKNPLALLAYYCGIFSLIPAVGLVLGPVSVLLGVLGFRYGMRNPRAKGTGHAVAGIVFGVLFFVINVAVCYYVVRYAFNLDGGKTVPYRKG